VLGLGLIMVHLYCDFVLRSRRYRVPWKGVAMFRVDAGVSYYDLALQSRILILLCEVGGLGLPKREY
jgi:hypothetical protein